MLPPWNESYNKPRQHVKKRSITLLTKAWASWVAPLVKNPPAMQETLVLFLGQEVSPREVIGYPLQYSWASLVAQMVKNPHAMCETWVPSLGWEDPQEKGKATHSSILAWRIPWTTVHGVTKSQTQLSDFHFPQFRDLISLSPG